jgi:hypothetical protein
MSNKFILEIKASVIAADMNAHAQFKHALVRQRKTRHAFAWRVFLPKEELHLY